MSEKRFYPVRGIEKTIKNLEITDGYIYFATDTGHIFMDVDDTRVNMVSSGATTFFIDLQKEYIEKVSQDLLDNYIFKKADLEKDLFLDIIQANDLFINVPTGQLFQVLEITDDSFICAEIIIKGTSSESSSEIPRVSLNLVSDFPSRFVYEKEYLVTFKAETAKSVVDTNAWLDDELTVELTVQGADDSSERTIRTTVQTGEEFSLDVGSLLYLGNNKVTIVASGDNSGRIEKKYYQKEATILQLERNPEENFNYKYYESGDNISFSCIVNGAVDKDLIIKVDGVSFITQHLTSDYSGIVFKDTLEYNNLVDVLGGSDNNIYGSHELEIELTAAAGSTTIEAHPLKFEFAYYDDAASLVPIAWFPNSTPDSVEQYSTIQIEYMAYNPDLSSSLSLIIYKNEVPISEFSELTYSVNNPYLYSITEYDNKDVFRFEFSNGKQNPVNKEFIVNTSASGKNLNIIDDGLILNLTAKDMSNNMDRFRREQWKNDPDEDEVVFNNFNWYNNGWIQDNEGNTCLRISNGANIFIPFPRGSNVLNSDSLPRSLALEFKFKIRNITEYTTLITHTVGENGEDVLVIEPEKSVFGRIAGADAQASLLLGTQEAIFNYGPVLNVRYKEDEMIQLSIVFDASRNLIQMYLNGILSSAQHFNNFINLNSEALGIEFNSKYCDLDLYNVRIYSGPFSLENVVHNYIANLSGQERLAAYEVNQIVKHTDSGEPTIDYYAMVQYNLDHPDTPIMPYAVVKVLSPGDDLLPYYKGNKKAVSVRFVNPYLDYLYDNGLIDDNTYLHSSPSFEFSSEEENFNVQGTSSQGYPRRNYKLKTKLKTNEEINYWRYTNGPQKGGNISKKWYMDSDLPADQFCWKADYMDSSGSYNTGFANFVSILYEHHPLYNIFQDENYDKYRTTIYGFPMLVFQEKKEAKNGQTDYEFVGKYNFNLDKSSNTRYGFELTESNPNNHQSIKEIAECWEFTNNQGTFCAFANKWPEVNDEGDKARFETVFNSFEYRYIKDDKALDKLYENYNWNENPKGNVALDGTKTPREYLANFEQLYKWVYTTTEDLNNLDDFISEFDEHLNFEYCAIYFIMTELLHCYDSRGKNLMMASWGPEASNGEYIWYPIFYDIDTQLGLNNSGEQLWDYYAEPTDKNLFATNQSRLWQAFWKAFKPRIINKYNEIRTGTKLDVDNLNGYYNFNPIYTHSYAMYGQRPLVAYNIDEYYKYIAPSYETGFINTSGLKDNDAFGHLYCLQGTRELARYLYLKNRFNYVDSKWQAGKYSYVNVNGGGFETRLNANYIASTSDRFLSDVDASQITDGYILNENWPNSLDANPEFTVKPFLKQYVSAFYDETLTDTFLYSDTNLTDPVYTPMTSLAGQTVYKKANDAEKYIKLNTVTQEDINSNDLYFLTIETIVANLNGNDGNAQILAEAWQNHRLFSKNDSDSSYELCADSDNVENGATYYIIDKTQYTSLVNESNYMNYYVKIIDGENNISYELASGQYDPNQIYYTKQIFYISEPTQNNEENILARIQVPADILDSYKKKKNLSQQLAYLPGAEYISDLGDLSTKYFNQFNIGGAYRLRSLKLGSDNTEYVEVDTVQSGKDYYKVVDNEYVKITSESDLNDPNIDKYEKILYENQLLKNILLASSESDAHPKTLLEEINLNGLSYFNSILDVSGCEKLSTFSALRTQLPQVAFAKGVQLRTAKFPETLKSLTLVEPTNLTTIATDSNDTLGLYIEGLTKYLDPNIEAPGTEVETSLNKISITGGNLGYQTYKLLSLLVQIKKYMIQKVNNGGTLKSGNSRFLQVGLRNVNWSPYLQVLSTNELEVGETYYRDNGRFKLESISNLEDISLSDIRNGLIFKINEDADGFSISNLDLLNELISIKNTALEEHNKQKNYFRNDNPLESQISLPEITGVIYINNSNENKYDETDLKTIQNEFLGLRIFCNNVNQGVKVSFYVEDILQSNLDYFTMLSEGQQISLSDLITDMNTDGISRIFVEAHYDFKRWQELEGSIELKYDPETRKLSQEDSSAMSFSNGAELKFSAVQELHKYELKFYYEKDANGNVVTNKYFIKKLTIEDSLEWDSLEDFYAYQDASNLAYNRIYVFKGFYLSADSGKTLVFSKDKKPIIDNIRKDREYYPLFEEAVITAQDQFIHENFFQVNNNGVLTPRVELNVKGKVLIPPSVNGVMVRSIGSFSNSTVSHIFLSNGFTQKINIIDEAFSENLNLVYFDFTKAIGEIGRRAFWKSKLRSPSNDRPFYIYANAINEQAFQLSENLDNIVILSSNNDGSIQLQPKTSTVELNLWTQQFSLLKDGMSAIRASIGTENERVKLVQNNTVAGATDSEVKACRFGKAVFQCSDNSAAPPSGKGSRFQFYLKDTDVFDPTIRGKFFYNCGQATLYFNYGENNPNNEELNPG